MIPVTITRKSAGPWLRFALRESGRKIRSIMFAKGDREAQALAYVQANAEEGNPESVLAALDDFAREEQFLMNVGDEKGAILSDLLVVNEVTRVLELGAYCGYSAVMIASKIASRGGKLISVEKSPELAEIARQVVAFAGLAEHVEFRVGTAAGILPTLDEEPFELVFIDHLKSSYLPDLKVLEDMGLMADGCRVVADNIGIFISSLDDYLDYVRNSPQYSSRYFPSCMEYVDSIEDGMEISVYRRFTA